MARAARIVVPGACHHVTQRGNNHQDIFFVDDDRHVYLELLRKQSQRFGFVVQGYCLMTNHVHVLGVPAREESLAKAIGRTHFLYTLYVNKLHNRSGHLWQNRFFSCAMDESHAHNALAYIELNPVRAKMVRTAGEYRWSSAAAHLGKEERNPYLDLADWHAAMPPKHWRATLKVIARDNDIQQALRSTIRTGRPLGSDSFVSKVETILGRRVRPLPMGRPKGWRKKKDGVKNDK